MIVAIPGAVGELIDKITILRLKAARITAPERLENVRLELDLLEKLRASQGIDGPRLAEPMARLEAINAELWDVEDAIRECERRGDFGERFIALARAVYKANDRRAAVKGEISALCGSTIVEEKSYADWGSK